MSWLPLQHVVTLVLLAIFLHLGVLGSVLQQLALSPWEIRYGMLMLILCSLVNIPLCRIARGVRAEAKVADAHADRVIIGINLGGVIVPLFFGLYLWREAMPELWSLLLLATGVALVVYPLSRVSERRGIVIQLGGSIVAAALGALWLGGAHYLLLAYWSALLGTLIGGDLLHLSQLLQRRRALQQGVFIGGAGLMDAVFLSGLFAMLTAELLHQHDLLSRLAG